MACTSTHDLSIHSPAPLPYSICNFIAVYIEVVAEPVVIILALSWNVVLTGEQGSICVPSCYQAFPTCFSLAKHLSLS